MLNWFRKPRYQFKTKKVKSCGMPFVIRKINPFDYLEGSLAVKQAFEIYKSGVTDPETAKTSTKKIKKHYIDVLCAGVVEPKLVRKEEDQTDETLWVENLLTEWDLASELYDAIYTFTYGKKKMKRSGLAEKE